MSAQSDLDIRIQGMQQEFQNLIATMAVRAAGLASELASCQARLKAADERIAELEKPRSIVNDKGNSQIMNCNDSP